MLTKTQPDEINSFLADASNMTSGHATRVVFPESIEEVGTVLAEASRERVQVTVSGAGTGLVGGRVPFGGIVLATDRLNKIQKIVHEGNGGWAIVGPGVVLADFQRAVDASGLLYPPDPTESTCYLGGTVATNASGPRTFKYGPTRRFVRRLKIALTTGDVLDLKRGEIYADANGSIQLPLPSGLRIKVQLPSYQMPKTRKHVAGYFVAPGMDALDLFIGSEGTLGVITEIEVQLLAKPEGVLSGVVFFENEKDLLGLVKRARSVSIETRTTNQSGGVDARALEYFDNESLKFLHTKYPAIPIIAAGALFFEQETTAQTDEDLTTKWLGLLEEHHALVEDSWFATNEQDRMRLREFRHSLPVLVNEWLTRHNQRKVSTDMAVPDDEFEAMLDFYKTSLRDTKLAYVIFGHIGDNHLHVNILPSDDREAASARELYSKFIQRAVSVGGTVSAEHGIGKLKREYLGVLYSDQHIEEMVELKCALDPAFILGAGNVFSERESPANSSFTRPSKRVVFGCIIAAMILISSIIWIRTGRIQKVRDNFERVVSGQSKEVVNKLLGEPVKTTDCKSLDISIPADFVDRCNLAYWYYGGAEIWQVYFDKSDHVLGTNHHNSIK